MSSKTRKFIGPMSLVAIIAVVGALAAFVVLGNGTAQAQQDLTTFTVDPAWDATDTTQVLTVAPGNGRLRVQWPAPADRGDPTLDGYVVEYVQSTAAPAADATWTVATRTGFADFSRTISGLTNGQDYWFRVGAFLATDGTIDDTGANYLVSTAAVSPAGTVPDEPTNVMVTQTSEVDDQTTPNDPTDDTADATVSWDAPEDDGGSPIIGYVVEVDADGGTAFTPTANWAAAVLLADLDEDQAGFSLSTSEVLEDLEDGAQVRVTAINSTTLATASGASLIQADLTAATDSQSDLATFSLEEAPDISILDFTGKIESDSTSGGGAPQFTVTIPALTTALPVGSSIVLYLEDDYQEPDLIPASSVYFVADQPRSEMTGNGARVYATRASTIENDDYFDSTKNDISIRVFIPDMCTTDTTACSGANGPASGQRLRMIVEDTSGIKNPTEAGKHSADFRVLGPADSVPLIGPATSGGANHKGITELETKAKISLSDSNNTRGYEMIVTATGFNDKTTAGAYVLVQQSGTPTCADVINLGASVGGAIVGSDDVASISFEVTSPTFKPGKVNYICVADGEGRQATDDVEQFELEDSIRVVPSTVNAGDTVTVFAEDFLPGLAFSKLEVSGAVISATFPGIGSDGSSTGTFVMPGSINDNPVVGVRSVKAYWQSADASIKKNAATTITVSPAELAASATTVLPNESITLTGNGYGTQSCIPITNITLDNVQIQVDDDSIIRCDPDGPTLADGSNSDPEVDAVEVSNSGQFVATVTLWPENAGDNPTLISGTHTLNVEDSKGFTGSTTLTIAEPTISVNPGVVGPRDYIVISGTNWPVDNTDNSNAGLVEVVIKDDPRSDRKYSVYTDGTGRFSVEHRVSRDVPIP